MSETTGGADSEVVDVEGDTAEAGTVAQVSGENNNNPATIIGEPLSDNYNVDQSVVWTHNYFRKKSPSEAVCLSCEAENEANKGNKKYIPKQIEFKTPGASTSALRRHINLKHKDLAPKFLEQEANVKAKKG